MQDQFNSQMIRLGTGRSCSRQWFRQERHKNGQDTSRIGGSFGRKLAAVRRMMTKGAFVFHQGIGLLQRIFAQLNLFTDDSVKE